MEEWIANPYVVESSYYDEEDDEGNNEDEEDDVDAVEDESDADTNISIGDMGEAFD